MICKKCNGPVDEGLKFCPNCGAPTETLDNGQNSIENSIKKMLNDSKDETDQYDSKDINDNKLMGGLAYFLFFLPLIACPNSKYGRFHANQGLILLITGILFSIVNAILSSLILAISWRLWFLTSFISFVLWVPLCVVGIIGMINGFTGKAKALPVIGKFKIIK